jgi:chemotaxis protein CheD
LMDFGQTKPTCANYFLMPGYIFAPDVPTVISSVLGSSVSICLFDRKRNMGGMNHFLVPLAQRAQNLTPRFGNVATLALIRLMIQAGPKKGHLEAQILGGAYDPERCSKDVGAENVRVARRVLMREGVRVVSEDTGGEKGRKIVFNTGTNEVAVLKVERVRKGDWYPYEGDR